MKTVLESINDCVLSDTRPAYRSRAYKDTDDVMAHVSDYSVSIMYKGKRPDLAEKFMNERYDISVGWSAEDDALVIPLSGELMRSIELEEQFATELAYNGLCYSDFEI